MEMTAKSCYPDIRFSVTSLQSRFCRARSVPAEKYPHSDTSASSECCESAVDGYDLARDVRGFLREKEEREIGSLPRSAVPTH